jgi:long-chain acyl-CoA synthetase
VLCLVPLIIERVYNKKVKPKLMESIIIKNMIRISFFKKLVYRRAVKAIVEYFGGQLNVIAFGGAPLDGEVEEFLMKGRFPYVFGYGLTEAAGLACGAPNEKTRAHACGYPIRYLQVKIADPDPATGVGEIMIKSPTVMAGYYKNEKLTREVLSKDGWLKTGDRGTLDKNGYLHIKGRSKAMFLSASGENVYPEIIEEKLRKFPIVQEALARESKGTIEALVYPDPDVLAKKIEGKSETDREQIIGEILENIRIAVNKRLPHFYRIKKCVYQAEPFIKNATNKIKRFLYSSKKDADHSAAN